MEIRLQSSQNYGDSFFKLLLNESAPKAIYREQLG